MRNAFTVDVEDYFQVSGFESFIRRSDWDQFESRVVKNTRRILAILQSYHVHATFFVLGWIARKHPQIVQEIHRDGHEIGSHGFWHRLVYAQSPDEFRQDLCDSRDVLEDIIGQPVTSYRAPSFSITQRSLWALDILVQEGFTVDSSIFPVRHDRYGIPNAQPTVHRIETSSGPLVEFPPSIARIGPLSMPIGGGGYFRLYPTAVTMHGLAYINRRHNRPFMFYVHPWEIDPNQPRFERGSHLTRFRHYVNLARTEAKLDRLLQRFQFARVRDIVAASDVGSDDGVDASSENSTITNP